MSVRAVKKTESDLDHSSVQPVPRTVVDCSMSPPEHRLAAIRQFNKGFLNYRPLGELSAFNLRVASWRVGDILFNDLYYDGSISSRAVANPNFLSLVRLVAGESETIYANGIDRAQVDRMYLREGNTAFEMICPSAHTQAILIPRRFLPAARHDPGVDMISWSKADLEGRMIDQLWTSLLEEFPRVSLDHAARLTEAFISYLNKMIQYRWVGQSHESLLPRIKSYIDAHLRRDVTIDELCNALGLSRSALYREFEPFGGVAKYVLQERLLRCHQMLSNADPDQVKIMNIAQTWNFDEASTFSRSFRRQFGVPPSRVLGQEHLIDETSPIPHLNDDSIDAFGHWLLAATQQD